MSLLHSDLAAVIAELQPLAGGTVQKIAAPAPRTVIFELRLPGATRRLLLCAESGETRIHLLHGERPPSPNPPLPIQNLLRAHLLPSKLIRLELVEGDRIVRLAFDTPAGPRTLIAELTGRQGNLILLGAEERILGAAAMGPAGARQLTAGRRYELPPPPPPPSLAAARFPGQPGAGGAFSISRAIEEHYGPLAFERALEERRRRAARSVAAALRRSEAAIGKVEADLERARSAEGLRRMGDLLAPLASRIPRGAEKVVATDYTEDGPVEVEVPLLPTLSGSENRDLYYKRYKRLSGAVVRIEARRGELVERRDRLASIQARLQDAQGVELERLLDEAERLGPSQRKGSVVQGGPALPYRTFLSASGRPIWVGKGAKANDALTFRAAKGNDLWMHARGRPGAHVVVPQPKGSELDEQTLLDACALAAHFSGARGEAVAEIAHTQVKNVKKPKGAAHGAVILVNERSRAYRHDPDRIARLLAGD